MAMFIGVPISLTIGSCSLSMGQQGCIVWGWLVVWRVPILAIALVSSRALYQSPNLSYLCFKMKNAFYNLYTTFQLWNSGGFMLEEHVENCLMASYIVDHLFGSHSGLWLLASWFASLRPCLRLPTLCVRYWICVKWGNGDPADELRINRSLQRELCMKLSLKEKVTFKR